MPLGTYILPHTPQGYKARGARLTESSRGIWLQTWRHSQPCQSPPSSAPDLSSQPPADWAQPDLGDRDMLPLVPDPLQQRRLPGTSAADTSGPALLPLPRTRGLLRNRLPQEHLLEMGSSSEPGFKRWGGLVRHAGHRSGTTVGPLKGPGDAIHSCRFPSLPHEHL
ncbi:Hypothetical predicted protein [Pelobates cultripes]|uniref:Uncharacterized protein n=1 Tax=Pelobates cultripes TaxID=61616 RepID=A0AAD1RU05_PELCU|nr:Hypothetical predicted protein [Pelobates cultripes]